MRVSYWRDRGVVCVMGRSLDILESGRAAGVRDSISLDLVVFVYVPNELQIKSTKVVGM